MNQDKLVILWTNADPITSELMVLMYASNAIPNGWWKEVEIIVWGATAKLLANTPNISSKLLDIQSSGVTVRCCLACANELGVAQKLEHLGFTLEYMGQALTDFIKEDVKVLSI